MAPLQRLKSVIQVTDQLQIQHFTHQHLLHKLYTTFEFNCGGCNTGGYGVRYRCSACDFDLHEQCATSPHRMFSHIHPHHQLVLVNRLGESRFCGVCRGFTNGLSYTCECQTCEFDVHPLCIKIPVANGVPSAILDHSQQAEGVSWGQPTTQHVNINQQQLQQKQGIPATSFGGYYELNHNQQQNQGMPFGGYYELNNIQPVMINHPQHQHQQQHPHQHQHRHQHQHQHQQQQQQQQFHQQQPGLPMAVFNGYPGVNNGQPMMINHHQQSQKQGMPTTAFNGYNGVNTTQTMINHYQQNPYQQGMPATTTFGGYNGVNNNNQSVMSNQQQQQPAKSSTYSKLGKFAANIVTTSLIGVPLFNQRN